MATPKATPLSSNLLATKGSGAPVSTQPAAQETSAAVPVAAPAPVLARPVKKKPSSGISKTLSYRCGGAKYKALRQAVLDYELTGQEILDQALDLWFATQGIEVAPDE